MSRTLKVTVYHVKFTRFMLLPISEEVKTRLPIFLHSMYNKTIITCRFGFCDIQDNQGLGKDYRPKPNPYLHLDYHINITKPHPIIVYCVYSHPWCIKSPIRAKTRPFDSQ